MHSSAQEATAHASSLSVKPQSALFKGNGVWLGAIVPKRWAKRAVTRNLIKRQIYNVASRYEALFPVAAHVVRLRAGFDRQQFMSAASDQLKKAVRMEIDQLFSKVLETTPKVLT